MSTVNLPPIHFSYLRNNRGMDDRRQEIEKIKARMKELGFSSRGLSMRATGKPDTIRNLLSGKAQHWRGDTYRAVMKVLWPEPEKTENNRNLEEMHLGLLKGFESIIAIMLIKHTIPNKNDLELVFNDQLREFRKHKQLDAAAVMDQLLDFLHSKSFELSAPQSQQFPQHLEDRSQKEKILKDQS